MIPDLCITPEICICLIVDITILRSHISFKIFFVDTELGHHQNMMSDTFVH